MNTALSLGRDKLSELNLNSLRNMKYLPSGTAANHDKVSIMGMITTETEQSKYVEKYFGLGS